MTVNLSPTAQTLQVIAKAQAGEASRAKAAAAAAERAPVKEPNRAAAFLEAREADRQARAALQRRFQDQTLPPHDELRHLRAGSIVDVSV